MAAHAPVPLPDPDAVPLLTLDETAKILRLGRTTSYALARQNALPCPVMRIGASYRISTRALLSALRLSAPTKSHREQSR